MRVYAKDRLGGLVPNYRVKSGSGQPIYRPLIIPIEIKLPGRPKRSGKTEFTARISRHWRYLPLEGRVRLSVFYFFPIPKKTKMRKRMEMLRGRISHKGKPNLDALNAFVVDCLAGTVFKNHSQIVELHAAKSFAWWPQTLILIRPLPG
jgi:Holliday junction resolvase RusA-like endonuclease